MPLLRAARCRTAGRADAAVACPPLRHSKADDAARLRVDPGGVLDGPKGWAALMSAAQARMQRRETNRA
jgi:hypothetical protein